MFDCLMFVENVVRSSDVSVGIADILHNSSYSDENIITRRRQPLKGFLLL